MNLRILICIVAVLILSPLVAQAATTQEPVGARPSAMAGAFTGIADDGNALYWNPAGMAFLNHHEITASYSDLYGIDINNGYVGYTYPVTDRLAVGIDWFNIGFKDSELDYAFNKFNVGVAYRFLKQASVGGTLKFLNTSTSYDNQSRGKGDGISGDIGAMYRYNDRLSFGATIHNLFDADVTYDNGTAARFYDMKARVGVGYSPIENLLLGVDIGDRAHFGGEYLIEELLALRAGLQRDLHRDPENVYSFGAGIRYSPVQFDYSLTSYPYLSETSRFSLSLFFNFGYSLVAVHDVSTVGGPALFPSRWSTYRATPFLAFQLENKDDKPLQCNWEVNLGEMMSSPSQGQLVLRPHETQPVYVTGNFSDEFLANASDAVKTGTVLLTYTRGREPKTVKQDFDVFVYENGAIDWNENTAWASSFVTPEDPAVRAFATSVLDMQPTPPGSSALFDNIVTAMTLLNGLAADGIRYLPDPNNPYDAIQQKATGLDNVQLPALLLDSKRGDCDDLTVLFCSLLESVGIRTIILDVPGHLFMMFDSGIPGAYRIAVRLDEGLLVDYGGEVFIPVEVTELMNGFEEAWRQGAQKYRRWERLGELTVINVHEAWQQFPSMPVAHTLARRFDNQEQLASRVDSDWAVLTRAQEEYVQEHYEAPIAGLVDDPAAVNRRALNEVFKGNYEAGRRLLESTLARDSAQPDIMINLANTLSLLGRFDEAMRLYEDARVTGATTAVAVNHIIAACLSVDTVNHDSSKISNVKTLLARYRDSKVLSIDENMLDKCMSTSAGGKELAECARLAIKQGEFDAGVLEKGEREVSNPVTAEVRLFQWLY